MDDGSHESIAALVADAGTAGEDGPAAVLSEHPAVDVDRVPSASGVADRLAARGTAPDCVVTGHRAAGVDAPRVATVVARAAPAVPVVVAAPRREATVASDALDAGADDVAWLDAGPRALADRLRRAVDDATAVATDRAAAGRFERFVDHLPGVVYRCRDDPGWPFEFLSRGCADLTGYSREAVESGAVSWEDDIIHEADRDRVRTEVETALSADAPFEVTYRIRTADGTVRHVLEQGSTGPVDEHDVASDGPGSPTDRSGRVGAGAAGNPTGGRDRVRDGDGDGNRGGDDPVYLEGYITDVTERRERELELAEQSSLLDAIFEQVPVHLYVKDAQARHLRVSDYLEGSDRFLGRTDVEASEPGDDRAQRTTAIDREVIETGDPVIDREEYDPDHDRWFLTSKVPWRGADGEVHGLIGVSREVTERKRRRRALQRQNDRLEEFASVVTHDLRNPLSVAIGYVDRARELSRDPDVTEPLSVATDALDRIDGRIEEILAFARHGRTVVEPEPVDVDDLVGGAWAAVGGDDAGVALTRDATIGTVSGDPDRLGRMLENLLANAREHATSEVRVGPMPDGLFVADDGPGVALDDPEAVFDRGVSTGEGGAGLGLAVVREIVEAHGWSVSVADDGPGGARFEVTDVDRPDG
jgi:PAS domain S-box-containing protein